MTLLSFTDNEGGDNEVSAAVQSVSPPIPPAVAAQPWGGIPLVESFGDCHQIPPIGMKMIFDPSPASLPDSACANGCIAFHDFLNPLPESGMKSLVVSMTEIIR